MVGKWYFWDVFSTFEICDSMLPSGPKAIFFPGWSATFCLRHRENWKKGAASKLIWRGERRGKDLRSHFFVEKKTHPGKHPGTLFLRQLWFGFRGKVREVIRNACLPGIFEWLVQLYSDLLLRCFEKVNQKIFSRRWWSVWWWIYHGTIRKNITKKKQIQMCKLISWIRY